MEKEKFVKKLGHKDRLKIMEAHLQKALLEVGKAQRLASKTAACCEVSLDDLISEIEGQLANVQNHGQDGILEGDIIIKGKAGQI